MRLNRKQNQNYLRTISAKHAPIEFGKVSKNQIRKRLRDRAPKEFGDVLIFTDGTTHVVRSTGQHVNPHRKTRQQKRAGRLFQDILGSPAPIAKAA